MTVAIQIKLGMIIHIYKFAKSNSGADYLENNCAEEPNKLCEFKRLSGRILKTVDSVYQDVSSVDECRELCLNSPYRYVNAIYMPIPPIHRVKFDE